MKRNKITSPAPASNNAGELVRLVKLVPIEELEVDAAVLELLSPSEASACCAAL